MKIKDVIYNPVKRTVTVYYLSGAVRTYRGRVPFSVCEYLTSFNYEWGFNDGSRSRELDAAENDLARAMEGVYYG